MKTCPEAQRRFQTGTIDPQHCEVCRSLAVELESREGDLERGIDAFARGGDLEGAMGKALADAPQGPQRPAGFGRFFHDALVAVAAVAVLMVFVAQFSGPLAPPPVPAAETTDVEPIEAYLDESEAISWDALTTDEWRERALTLWGMALQVDQAAEGTATRPLLFRLWVQAGRAGENANDPTPPLYARYGGQPVNDGFFRAATMQAADPSLGALVQDAFIQSSVRSYIAQIERDTLPRSYAKTLSRDDLRSRVDETRKLPSNGLSEEAWGLRADALRQGALQLEATVDLENADDRRLLFELHAYAQQAAQNAGLSTPPFYRSVDGKVQAVHWVKAGELAAKDPALLQAVDGDLRAAIEASLSGAP